MVLTFKARGTSTLPIAAGRPGRKSVGRSLRQWQKNKRNELLLDVANLEITGLTQFWKKWGSLYEDIENDSSLLELRDQLRGLCEDPRAADFIFDRWTKWEFPTNGWFAHVWSYTALDGLQPNPGHIRLNLIFALGELIPKLRRCRAPECPAPYFVAYRGAKQQFCDRPACLEYSQKFHKRRWWRKNRGKAGPNRIAD